MISCAMLSDDYKERFVAEAAQLKIRIEKLDRVIEGYGDESLGFVPETPFPILSAQYHAMLAYMDVLVARSAIEGIDISHLF